MLEVHRTRTLRLVLAAVLLAMPVSLAAAPGEQHLVRIGLALLAVALGLRPALSIALGLGERALRQIEWAAEGCWYLTDGLGRRFPAELQASSVSLGAWLLLSWKGPSGRRFQALLEAAAVHPGAFRALKGHLNC